MASKVKPKVNFKKHLDFSALLWVAFVPASGTHHHLLWSPFSCQAETGGAGPALDLSVTRSGHGCLSCSAFRSCRCGTLYRGSSVFPQGSQTLPGLKADGFIKFACLPPFPLPTPSLHLVCVCRGGACPVAFTWRSEENLWESSVSMWIQRIELGLLV